MMGRDLRQFLLIVLAWFGFVLILTNAAMAQTATPMHKFLWDMNGDTTGLTYEVSVDGQAHAPVLGVTCAGSPVVCRGDLPTSLTAGAHTAALRSVLLVDGQRLVSQPSNTLSFTYTALPGAPTNLRLEVSGTLTIKIGGQ